MNAHLTDIECAAAAAGELAHDRALHAAECDACREQVDAARAFLRRIEAADIPDPSPLFWEHFPARVHRAVREQSSTARVFSTWRAWTSLAAAAAVVIVAAWIVRQPISVKDGGVGVAAELAFPDATADVAWESVLAATPAWSDDELMAFADQTAMSFDELTGAERAAFVRLLEEMEVMQ